MLSNTLVVLAEPGYRASYYYRTSMAGIENAASKRGVPVAQVSSLHELSPGRLPRTVVLVCAGLAWTKQTVDALRDLCVKSLVVGAPPSFFGADVSGVDVNRQKLLSDTVGYLLRAGRRRIASVGHDPENANDLARERSFLQAMQKLSGREASRDVYSMDRGLKRCIDRFLDNAGRYGAAICVNDAVAVQLTLMAQEAHIHIPRDLYVVGSGDFHMARLVKPTLTTTTLDYHQMGVLAFDIWHKLERNPEIDGMTISITGEIICRESTARFPIDGPEVDPSDLLTSDDDIKENGTLQLEMLENCLRQLDELDCQIIRELMRDTSIEHIAEKLFVSHGTINYRLKKLYAANNVKSRKEFVCLFSTYVDNPEDLIRFLR